MPQIAQQDYLTVQLEFSGENQLTEDSKKRVKSVVERGILFDCVFFFQSAYNRVIGLDKVAEVINVYDSSSESVLTLSYGEE
jgi:hypothetical protein